MIVNFKTLFLIWSIVAGSLFTWALTRQYVAPYNFNCTKYSVEQQECVTYERKNP